MDVEIDGKIDSVMNPSGGIIKADYIEEFIVDKEKVDPDQTVITCRMSNTTEQMAG